MPYFEISLNDEPRAIIGCDDLDILTFGLISTHGSPNAYLQVTSMNKAAAEHEILFRRQLRRGECLLAAFQQTSSVSVESMLRQNALESTTCISKRSELAGRVGFAVKLNSMGLVSASVDDDSMLHVAASWTKAKDQCLFEIVCIRMTSDGQNQMLLELEIMPGQPFSIQVV